MKGKSGLTVKEKILLHLAYFSEHHNDHRVPREVSQKGIAEAVGISQKHLSQYIRPMIKADLVLERSSYILEGRQRQKVWFLTELGRRRQNGCEMALHESGHIPCRNVLASSCLN